MIEWNLGAPCSKCLAQYNVVLGLLELNCDWRYRDRFLAWVLRRYFRWRQATAGNTSCSLSKCMLLCIWWGHKRQLKSLYKYNAVKAIPLEKNANFISNTFGRTGGDIEDSLPGSSLYLEKVPWLRLVMCLLGLADSRDVIKGRGWKVKVCLHWAHILSPVGSGICNPPAVDQQNSKRSLTWLMLEFSAFNVWLKG